MNISSKQQGSALVIVIIILVVGVIGALGYVFWSNYLAPKDETQQVNNAPTSSEDETTNVAPNTYENETYSFQYPEEYWSVSEERDENINIGRITPVIKTDNWEQTGMGLDAGAQVAIYTSEATRSLSQLKDDAATFADGAARDQIGRASCRERV